MVEEALPATLDEARAALRAGRAGLYERSLRELARSTDEVTRRRALSLLALHLFDTSRYTDAIPLLEQAAAANPLISPSLTLRLIDAHEALGQHAAAVTAAQTILMTAPASSAATIARLHLPALHAAAGENAAANTALEQLPAIPIDEMTEGELAELADRLESLGLTDAATSIRMRLLSESPRGRFTETIYEKLAKASISPLDALSTADATNLAQTLARADRYDQALDLLERISVRPDAGSSDIYRSVRLRALFNSRKYERLLLETTPAQMSDPSLLLLRSRAAWRADQPAEFLAGLDLLQQKFPTSRQVLEGRVLRAKYHTTDQVDFARAVEELSAAIEGGVVGNDGENIWTLGWTQFLWGRYDDALRTFDSYISAYPDGDYKTNSLFWSAKIHQKRGDSAAQQAALRRIETEYPYSYYSYRARQILGEPTVAPSRIDGGAIFPDTEAQLAGVTSSRIDTIRELAAVDLSVDAAREAKALSLEYPDNSGVALLLADVYVRGGEPFKANGVLQRRFRQFVRHGGAGVPRRFWEILFPLNYWPAIQAEAARRNVDPYVLASIIRQESGFEPSTVSNAGAVGLMQIMPAEVERIASAGGIEGVSRQALFDPATNIAVGAAEYVQKLAAMKGDPNLAVAAYNAGETAVGRWLAQTPAEDIDLFVESIPFGETRLYVKSVTRNQFEYRRIYESSPAAPQ